MKSNICITSSNESAPHSLNHLTLVLDLKLQAQRNWLRCWNLTLVL